MAQVRTIEGVGIGWKPELPSARDYHFADRQPMKAVSELPRRVFLGDTDSPIRNQGGEGSCTGHMAAGIADQIARQKSKRTKVIYGPRFSYNLARVLEGGKFTDDLTHIISGGPQLTGDNGAYIRDAMDGLRRFGALTEVSWKYRPIDDPKGKNDYKIVPSDKRLKLAHTFRIETNRCDDADAVINALAAGHPVGGGFTCFSSWWTPAVDKSGLFDMPTPKATEDGGHATKWSGYDLDFKFPSGQVGAIIFKNSWSTAWATNSPLGVPAGYGAFPIEFIKRTWADDMWAAIQQSA